MSDQPSLDDFETYTVKTYNADKTPPEQVHTVTTNMDQAVRDYVRLVAHDLKPYITSNLQPGCQWRSSTGWRTAEELATRFTQ